jgi:hypothetical protein
VQGQRRGSATIGAPAPGELSAQALLLLEVHKAAIGQVDRHAEPALQGLLDARILLAHLPVALLAALLVGEPEGLLLLGGHGQEPRLARLAPPLHLLPVHLLPVLPLLGPPLLEQFGLAGALLRLAQALRRWRK